MLHARIPNTRLWSDWRLVVIRPTAPQLIRGRAAWGRAKDLARLAGKPTDGTVLDVITWGDTSFYATLPEQHMTPPTDPDLEAQVQYMTWADTPAATELRALGKTYLDAVQAIGSVSERVASLLLPSVLQAQDLAAYVKLFESQRMALSAWERERLEELWQTADRARLALNEAEQRIFIY